MSDGRRVDGITSSSAREPAQFITRDECLSCGSGVRTVASGSFDDEPLRTLIAADPWGESPVPYLAGATWEFVECVACRLTFHRRILSPAWNAIRFERWMTAEAIAEFERLHSSPEARFERGVHFARHVLQLEDLTRELRGAERARVLDFGCGDGEFLQQCELLGLEAAGVDRSTARQDRSRTPIYGSLNELEGRQFHAVTLFEVLEHLDDPRAVLEALREHLVPGGILVLETPDCTGVRGIRDHHEYAMINPLDHINAFTPTTMTALTRRLGFEPFRPPACHVTCDASRIFRTEAKRLLAFAVSARTQQYFRKVAHK